MGDVELDYDHEYLMDAWKTHNTVTYNGLTSRFCPVSYDIQYELNIWLCGCMSTDEDLSGLPQGSRVDLVTVSAARSKSGCSWTNFKRANMHQLQEGFCRITLCE
jgi:hypothetical protein